METWGLDLSTSPANTGLVKLIWPTRGPAKITEYRNPKRSLIETLIRGSQGSWWAVDVPFGWPAGFGRWLDQHFDRPSAPSAPGNDAASGLDGESWKAVARRATDLFVQNINETPGAGFSVSFDKLGATAAAWSTIEAALATPTADGPAVTIDRSGLYRDGHQHARVVETWPSAAWWAFARNGPVRSARTNPARMEASDFRSALEGIVVLADDALLCLSSRPKGEHFRDALVCALVARARALNATQLPKAMPHNGWTEAEVEERARREGWIHLPATGLSGLLVATME